MATIHEQIVAAYEAYLTENEKFEGKGVGAAGTRARGALELWLYLQNNKHHKWLRLRRPQILYYSQKETTSKRQEKQTQGNSRN